MNLEEFKLATKDELDAYGETLPMDVVRDQNERLLSYKESNGFWHECTYNKNGNILTFKNSEGYWYETTLDQNNKVLTHKDFYGFDGVAIAHGVYILYYDIASKNYKSVCKILSYKECLTYYKLNGYKHVDADNFIKAIKKHHKNLKDI